MRGGQAQMDLAQRTGGPAAYEIKDAIDDKIYGDGDFKDTVYKGQLHPRAHYEHK